MSVPDRVRWAVSLVDPRAARVLEIGCGPGHAVALLCERPGAIEVVAIDRSATAVARARERNVAHLATGRARIERAALEDVALGAMLRAPFDAALAVNVNAFWTRPAPSFDGARRLLRPHALLYLAFEPPPGRDGAALGARVAALCAAHGFRVEPTRVQPDGRAVCVVARSG